MCSSQPIPSMIKTIFISRGWTINQSQGRKKCPKISNRLVKNIALLRMLQVLKICFQMMKKKSQKPSKKMDKMYKKMIEKEKLRLKKKYLKKTQKKHVP